MDVRFAETVCHNFERETHIDLFPTVRLVHTSVIRLRTYQYSVRYNGCRNPRPRFEVEIPLNQLIALGFLNRLCWNVDL